MKITEEQAREISWSESDEFETVETGDFIADHKYENQTVIFKPTDGDSHYMLFVSRSGSAFTDWYYDYVLDCPEVEQVEVVTTEWITKK